MNACHAHRVIPAILLVSIGLSLLAPDVAQAKKYTLKELLELAHEQNPRIRAAAAATEALQAQATEAHR